MKTRYLALATVLTTLILIAVGVSYEQTQTVRNLAASETVAPVAADLHRSEIQDQLVTGSRRDSGDREGYVGRTGRAIDAGQGYAYDTIRLSEYDNLRQDQGANQDTSGQEPRIGRSSREVESKETAIVAKSQTWVQVVNDKEATVGKPTGWVPPLATQDKPDNDTEHSCKTCQGDDCKCPPYICERGFCDKNYAIVFGAQWCRYCPKMYPVIEELRKQGFMIIYIDTDKHPKVAKKFNLAMWPTTVIMDEGKEQARHSGVTTADSIKEHLKKTVKEQSSPYDDLIREKLQTDPKEQ